MSRKTVLLNDDIYAVVEPIEPEQYEVAGAKTLIRFRVVELRAAKEAIREE
jgi:hypothetical protein